MAVFWDVAPCSLVDIDRRFRGDYCFHYQGDEALRLHGTTSLKTAVVMQEP
jgi:hypothetical protein